MWFFFPDPNKEWRRMLFSVVDTLLQFKNKIFQIILWNITLPFQPLSTHATTAAATTKHVYSMSRLSTNQYDALLLIKSLFGEAAFTSQSKSRAVSSAEALGPPNKFQKEMNGEKKCERGAGKKITCSRVYKKDSYSSQSIQSFFFFYIVGILHGAVFTMTKE